MDTCSWHNYFRRAKPYVVAIWLVVNQPVIVGVALTLGLPYTFQKYAEYSSKRERVDKADLQIGNAVFLLGSRLNTSKTCEEIAAALLLFNSPSPIYPEFKNMPMTGVFLDLLKNLPDEKSKYALYPGYEAVSRLQFLESAIRKSCDVESSKKLIREDFLGSALKIRPWFNIPTAYEHLVR